LTSRLRRTHTDVKGDVKVGDFGLASSRTALADNSDGTDDPVPLPKNSDLTSGECDPIYVPDPIDITQVLELVCISHPRFSNGKQGKIIPRQICTV
jgi:hypothetical protein